MVACSQAFSHNLVPDLKRKERRAGECSVAGPCAEAEAVWRPRAEVRCMRARIPTGYKGSFIFNDFL